MEPIKTRSISDADKKVAFRSNKISVASQGGVHVEMHDYKPSVKKVKLSLISTFATKRWYLIKSILILIEKAMQKY